MRTSAATQLPLDRLAAMARDVGDEATARWYDQATPERTGETRPGVAAGTP